MSRGVFEIEEDQSLEEAQAATKPKAVRRGHLWHPFQERHSPFEFGVLFSESGRLRHISFMTFWDD